MELVTTKKKAKLESTRNDKAKVENGKCTRCGAQGLGKQTQFHLCNTNFENLKSNQLNRLSEQDNNKKNEHPEEKRIESPTDITKGNLFSLASRENLIDSEKILLLKFLKTEQKDTAFIDTFLESGGFANLKEWFDVGSVDMKKQILLFFLNLQVKNNQFKEKIDGLFLSAQSIDGLKLLTTPYLKNHVQNSTPTTSDILSEKGMLQEKSSSFIMNSSLSSKEKVERANKVWKEQIEEWKMTRVQNKKKERGIYFVPEDRLVSVRNFKKDEPLRNHNIEIRNYQNKNSSDLKSIIPSVSLIEWQTPPENELPLEVISNTPQVESKFLKLENEREASTLAEFYWSGDQIPDTPAEPDENESNLEEPIEIPWLTPKEQNDQSKINFSNSNNSSIPWFDDRNSMNGNSITSVLPNRQTNKFSEAIKLFQNSTPLQNSSNNQPNSPKKNNNNNFSPNQILGGLNQLQSLLQHQTFPKNNIMNNLNNNINNNINNNNILKNFTNLQNPIQPVNNNTSGTKNIYASYVQAQQPNNSIGGIGIGMNNLNSQNNLNMNTQNNIYPFQQTQTFGFQNNNNFQNNQNSHTNQRKY